MDYAAFLNLVKRRGLDWRYKASMGKLVENFEISDKWYLRYKEYRSSTVEDEACEVADYIRNDEWFRIKVETLILGDYTDSEIGENFSLDEEAITAYRKIYYDVPSKAGRMIKIYIAAREQDKLGKEQKMSAIKIGKGFVDYWILGKIEEGFDIGDKFGSLKASLMNKLKEVDKVKFGTNAYAHLLKTYELIIKVGDGKKDVTAEEKFIDVLTKLVGKSLPDFQSKNDVINDGDE